MIFRATHSLQLGYAVTFYIIVSLWRSRIAFANIWKGITHTHSGSASNDLWNSIKKKERDGIDVYMFLKAFEACQQESRKKDIYIYTSQYQWYSQG